jgi:archaellum biogenesis ATPase FlaH
MKKGEIDPLYDNETLSNVAVVDAELLVEIEKKWLGLKKIFYFTDYNRKVFKFLKQLLRLGRFDQVIICSVAESKMYEHVVYKYLQAQFHYLTFETEGSYKSWLQMMYPKYHFATQKRGYYHKTSEWLSEDALAEK